MRAKSQHHPSLARAARNAVPLLALSLLAGCHSLAGIRVDQRVHAGDRSAELALWCRAPDSILSGETPLYEAFVALLLYPVDVIASTCVAVSAPFDDRLEVRGGPVGALAGICLPWVTLVPYVHPPFHLMGQPKELELTPAEFDLLLQRVQAGDGAAAYRELGKAAGLGELVYAVDCTR
ncbi:MAG: hypothetical protein MUC36_01385 [Planctomycetes bacterium]|jgi:hypothetical protein|nr:hypothetical protein [Planctomycetota bacterium]